MIWHQNSENLMKLQINNDNIFGNSNHLHILKETYMIIFNLEICKTAGTFSSTLSNQDGYDTLPAQNQ